MLKKKKKKNLKHNKIQIINKVSISINFEVFSKKVKIFKFYDYYFEYQLNIESKNLSSKIYHYR